MTEKEITQEQEEQQKKKKYWRMAPTILFGVLLSLGILGISACSNTGNVQNQEMDQGEETDNLSENEASDGNENDQKTDEEEENSITAVELLELDESLKYMGNLILVNSDHPYHFEENAADLGLEDVASYGSGIPIGEEGLQLASRIMEPLYQMIQDCNGALGCSDTGVTSAYRSWEVQQQIYSDYAINYGQSYAEAYVADPGYSEHHTGLALDMGIYYENGGVGSFSESDNAVWMDENCQNYGFIRRYKEDKVDITGINNESWHFRYVGIPHATYMNQQNLCLEEYIDFLRTQTSADNPITVTCVTGTYEIYATTESAIPIPEGDYTVEGDNIDGYIITILK